MPRPDQDYYARLGVSEQATEREIKAAYRALAKKLHPDLGGDAARLAAVNEAAEVLLDATRRAAYDFDRKRAGGAGSASPRPGSGRKPADTPRTSTGRTSVALCEACGAMNRVKGDPRVVPASCGQCGHALGTPVARGADEGPWSPPPAAAQTRARCPHCQMRNHVTAPPGGTQACLGCGKPFRPDEDEEGAEGLGTLLKEVSRALFGPEGRRASARGLAYVEGQLRALADEARRRREQLERGS